MEIASSPVMILSNYSDYYYVKVLWITCNLLRQPRWKLCEKTCQQKKSWIFFATSAHSQKVQNKFYLFYFIFKKYFKLFALNSTHCTVQQCVGKVVLQYFFLGGYVCVCVCVCVCWPRYCRNEWAIFHASSWSQRKLLLAYDIGFSHHSQISVRGSGDFCPWKAFYVPTWMTTFKPCPFSTIPTWQFGL
jgi:hypothetical protein